MGEDKKEEKKEKEEEEEREETKEEEKETNPRSPDGRPLRCQQCGFEAHPLCNCPAVNSFSVKARPQQLRMTDSDDEWEAPEHFWIGNPDRKGSGNGVKPENSHVEGDAGGLRPDHEQIGVENFSVP